MRHATPPKLPPACGSERQPAHAGNLHSAAETSRDEPAVCGEVIARLMSLAQECLQENRPAEALECYRAAVQADPRCAAALVGLADVLCTLGKASLAVDCYLQALAIEPAHLVARVNLAVLLLKNGRSEVAAGLLRPLVDSGVDHPTVAFNLANALCDLGEFDEARAHYSGVLARHPRPSKVLYNLVQITKFRDSDRPRLNEWTSIAQGAIRSDEDRIHLSFALGKALDDLGDYDDAWRHFTAGNNLVATGFDPDSHERRIDATIAQFTAQFLRDRVAGSSESESPVFIVGMPRSGTSLVEQILSAHPQVHARGERRELGALIAARAASLDCSIPEAAASLTPHQTQELADAYFTSVAPDLSALRFTDKMPANFLHLGWIALLFPRARIIHVRRDPRGVCLSCYQQHFTARLAFAYRLEHLARYWIAYDRLMTHWRQALPLPLCEVDYESIVAAPEETSRRLVEFCGLEWSPACQSSHEQKNAVTTASQWQVRQPIYQSSRARWRNYVAHLQPLLEAFRE